MRAGTQSFPIPTLAPVNYSIGLLLPYVLSFKLFLAQKHTFNGKKEKLLARTFYVKCGFKPSSIENPTEQVP